MIKIDKWYGRLGNNIQQMCNAYHIASKLGVGVIYPKHDHFEPCQIRGESIKSGNFFSQSENVISNDDLYESCNKFISEIFIKNDIELDSDIITCHIRNGDIFRSNPHKGFLQPPLKYYEKIFENESLTDMSRVWVVCSNEIPHNPLLEILHKWGCTIKMTPIQESIDIITNSTRFIASKSTFSKYLFYLSDKGSKIYFPDYIDYSTKYLECLKVNLPNYIKNGEWRADARQLDQMKKYNDNVTIYKYNDNYLMTNLKGKLI